VLFLGNEHVLKIKKVIFSTNEKPLREATTIGYLFRIYHKRINPFLQRSQKWVGPQNIELLLIFISRNTFGNSGWHSGQETIFRRFPKVLDSWWKISENGDRGSTQNFAARLMSIVVCSGEPFLKKMSKIKKCILFENKHVLKFKKCQFSRNKSPCGRLPP